jgi:hypothetical protein
LERKLKDESVVGLAGGSAHLLQSVLAGPPQKVVVPDDNTAQRVFAIRAAQSERERRSASSLIERMYASRGYQSSALPIEEPPHQKTFLASEQNIPLGTLTIGTDSPDGLLADSLFPDEVRRFRAEGYRVCEFIKLAMDRRARSTRLLAALFHVAYIYAHRFKKLHRLLIEVNPRHVSYYETMLGFEVIGTERHNARVDAPAVLLALDLGHAEEQIRIFGGKPELAATERSAYPHFFPAMDEAGIVGRLERAEEDVAHVLESIAGVSAVRQAARRAALNH